MVEEKLKIPFTERVMDSTELYLTEEVFFVGTGWEIKPVASVDRIAVNDGKVGKITSQIQVLYKQVVLVEEFRHTEWLTSVY